MPLLRRSRVSPSQRASFPETSIVTPTESKIRIALTSMVLKAWKGRLLETDVEEELYIEHPDGYRESQNEMD